MSDFMSSDEAANELGVDRRTLYAYIAAGEIAVIQYRPRGVIRIRREELDEFLARKEVTKKQAVEAKPRRRTTKTADRKTKTTHEKEKARLLERITPRKDRP